jgi:pyridinium-3,5-bisthiocarboxylic acid mononucleotide nickel chelatase
MRIAYLDCFSGISGDMFLGALVDAGVPEDLLRATVQALDVGASLEVSRVNRSGITATKVDVVINGEKDLPREVFQELKQECEHSHLHEHADDATVMDVNPEETASGDTTADDSHAHQHFDWPEEMQARGHSQTSHHSYPLAQEHAEGHEHAGHSHAGYQDGHDHQHGRSLKDIRAIISRAPISTTAKQRAIVIFETLGRAEAKVHNQALETIHFHEVGSVDAIVDIVCAAVGSEALGADQWICSPLNVGGGTVVCSHGTFPVPAPATVEMLQSRNAPVFSSGVQKELLTPTGAAIVTVLADHFGKMPEMAIGRTGYGAGYRDLPGHANVLRITVGEAITPATSETGTAASQAIDCILPVENISVLEATIDDMTPQMFGHFLERAIEAGALDAFVVPVQMKKNRPGMLLTVLTRPEDRERLAQVVFAETTTIGLRFRDEQRYVLPREVVTVHTMWGHVRIKVASIGGKDANLAPEYEDCRRIAVEHGVPLKNVMQEAIRTYLQSLEVKSHG